MKIRSVYLSDLIENSSYALSFPIKTEGFDKLSLLLFPIPLIIVSPRNEIISGLDYYYFLKENEENSGNKDTGESWKAIDVLEAELPFHEGLILNFNWKEKLTGLNLYEKLVFIKKIMPFVPVGDIYRKTALDIGIDKNLTERLDLLISDSFRDLLIRESITLKTALQICNFKIEDRERLLVLFGRVPFTSSHQQKIVEMIEEIIFRDKMGIGDLFEKLDILSILESEKPQKRIIDAFFKCRFPVYQKEEDAWLSEIKGLKLPGNSRVTHFPFFEKKELELSISVKSIDELKSILQKLK